MRHSLLPMAALLSAAFILPAHAEASKKSQDFVTKASVGDMFEIETSKLALEKGTTEDVKSFAQMMIDDHTKASSGLKDAAAESKSGAKPAAELDEKHQKKLDNLKAASGNDFDDKYLTAQTEAHDEAVSLYKNYSSDGDDETLKAFAAKTLPTLEMHKEHVADIKTK